MLHKLKEIYASIIPFQKEKSEQYRWYMTEQGEIFGIHRNELTEKDDKLLQTFCKRYEPNLPIKGATEQLWYERIFEERKTPIPSPFRFIYFQLSKNQMDPIRFTEAFGTLFEASLPILWKSETEGIIIEEMKILEEKIYFEQIINILIADLSVNIRFLVGPILDDLTHAASEFEGLIDMGEKLFTSSKQKVLHYIEAIPYLLVHQLPETERQQFAVSILKEFTEDQEMLTTLHTFFRHHLNISETAKRLYMHRNSLQYRIDKFSRETGIRVQSFPEALTVQLAIFATRGLIDDM